MAMFKKCDLKFAFLFAIIFSLFVVHYSFAQTSVGAVGGKVQQAVSEHRASDDTATNPFMSGEFPYKHPSLVTQAIALSAMSLLPFIMMLLTSFAKISIVLALLRNALGTQQAPPNQVINGISILITLFIMFPTGLKMWDAAKPVVEQRAPKNLVSAEAAEFIVEVADAAKEPFRDFLKKNSSVQHHKRFYQMAYRIAPPEYRANLSPDDFLTLVPAFILSQVKGAFEIGVLIYLPFFVIDLVTSNILLAMGMMMLSPVTISLPLKIFLLVMLDGWTLLITGLVETYR
jgi:type III secretion protein R